MRFTLSWFCLMLLLSVTSARRKKVDIYEYEDDYSNVSFLNFLIACSQGDADKVKGTIEAHPEYLNQHSDSGETCLHVAAILGQSQVTQVALDAGANPNVRSTFEAGHRMTPLAWNVYSGHIDTVRVLLEHEATDVNLDVDSMSRAGKKVTVLDLAYEALPDDHDEDDHVPDHSNSRRKKFYEMKELLLKHGAKTHAELSARSEL